MNIVISTHTGCIPGRGRGNISVPIVVVTGFALVTTQVLVKARTPPSALLFASFSCEQFPSFPTIQRTTSDFFCQLRRSQNQLGFKTIFFLSSISTRFLHAFSNAGMIFQSKRSLKAVEERIELLVDNGVFLHFATPESKILSPTNFGKRSRHSNVVIEAKDFISRRTLSVARNSDFSSSESLNLFACSINDFS